MAIILGKAKTTEEIKQRAWQLYKRYDRLSNAMHDRSMNAGIFQGEQAREDSRKSLEYRAKAVAMLEFINQIK